MPNRFLHALERWLSVVLRQKALEADEGVPPLIGASDFTDMLVDYLLTRIGDAPNACWTACEIDHATDDEIAATTSFPPEVLAAAFIGTVVELSFWQSDEGYELLCDNGMTGDEAREFAAALDVVTEKIAARGQAIIHRLNDPPEISLPRESGRHELG